MVAESAVASYQRDRRNNKPSTVTLAAHARRELIGRAELAPLVVSSGGIFIGERERANLANGAGLLRLYVVQLRMLQDYAFPLVMLSSSIVVKVNAQEPIELLRT